MKLMSNWKPFAAFLEYLSTVRQASDGTRAEFVTIFVTTAKWIYQSDQRGFAQIPCIRQAMDIRNRLQNSAKRTRADKTEDELKAESKWLDWGDFLKATQDLRKSFMETRLKRSPPTMESARNLHDLLLLTFLTTMPSRSSELRLLETVSWDYVMQKPSQMSIKQFVARERRNLLVKQPSGEYIMYLANYKMFWKKGVDVTQLVSKELIELLDIYLNEGHRGVLLNGVRSHQFLFTKRDHEPFQEAYFGRYLTNLLERETGVRCNFNLIRSSFITFFYDRADASKDTALRESIAQTMRHSTHEAERTYDRRRPQKKKMKGLEFLAELAAGRAE